MWGGGKVERETSEEKIIIVKGGGCETPRGEGHRGLSSLWVLGCKGCPGPRRDTCGNEGCWAQPVGWGSVEGVLTTSTTHAAVACCHAWERVLVRGCPPGTVLPRFLHKPQPFEHCAMFPPVVGCGFPSFPLGVFLPVFYVGTPHTNEAPLLPRTCTAFCGPHTSLGGSCSHEAALGFVPGWNHRYLVSLQV